MAKWVTISVADTGEVIAERVRVADNPWLRLKGLMFRKGLAEGEGLLLSPCNSVHSCFMRFEFDAIFLDNDNRVIHVIEAMKPGRFSPMIWKAKKVLEVNPGTAQSHALQASTKLSIT